VISAFGKNQSQSVMDCHLKCLILFVMNPYTLTHRTLHQQSAQAIPLSKTYQTGMHFPGMPNSIWPVIMTRVSAGLVVS
jgi:hypothetical protein